MKKTFKKAFCTFFATLFLISTLLSPFVFASYNDERFEVYSNMNENKFGGYKVPNLYRQDLAYSNHKTTPVVVTGGVAYVPLSLFLSYQYVSVKYSNDENKFYVINTKNGQYLSFDISKDIAETYDRTIMRMRTKIFYETRYVPARDVANVLGFMCDEYDDPTTGLYAFRVRDNTANLSFEKLLKMYVPERAPQKEPDNKPDVPPVEIPEKTDPPEIQNPDGQNNPKPPVVNTDPISKIAKRNVRIVVEANNTDGLENTLLVANTTGAKMTFSLTKDYILQNPEAVRQMLVFSHSLCVTANVENIQNKAQDEIINSFVLGLEQANTALYLVTKQKTHLCTIPQNILNAVQDKDILYMQLSQNGYIPVQYNYTVNETLPFYAAFEGIKNTVIDYQNPNSDKQINIKVVCNEKTPQYLNSTVEFINKYENFTTSAINESTAQIK